MHGDLLFHVGNYTHVTCKVKVRLVKKKMQHATASPSANSLLPLRGQDCTLHLL